MFTPQQLSDQIKKLTDQTAALAEAQELYREAIKDPAYKQMAEWLKSETKLTAEYARAEKEVAALKDREIAITSGDLERHLARQNQLRAESVRLSKTEALIAATARRDYIQTGGYQRQAEGSQKARAMDRASAHMEQIQDRYAAAKGRSEDIKSGEFQYAAHQNEGVARFERLTEAQETRIRVRENLTGRREDLRSGTTRDQAVADARVKIERDRVERAEAKAARSGYLEARYGATGGRVVEASESGLARGAMGVAGNVGTKAYSMAMSGFQNTVEMNRFNREIQLISREFAGALSPALEKATNAARGFREWMGGLSGGQQNAIMYGAIAAVGVKAASAASKRMLGMGLIEAGVAGASWYRGGAEAGAGAAVGGMGRAAPGGGRALASKAGAAGLFMAGAYAAYDKAGDSSKIQASDALHATPLSGLNQVGKMFSDDPVRDSWNWFMRQYGKLKPNDAVFQKKIQDAMLDDAPVTSAYEWAKGKVGLGSSKASSDDANGHRIVTPAMTGYNEIGGSYEQFSLATDMMDTQKSLLDALNRLAEAIERQNGPKSPHPQRGS